MEILGGAEVIRCLWLGWSKRLREPVKKEDLKAKGLKGGTRRPALAVGANEGGDLAVWRVAVGACKCRAIFPLLFSYVSHTVHRCWVQEVRLRRERERQEDKKMVVETTGDCVKVCNTSWWAYVESVAFILPTQALYLYIFSILYFIAHFFHTIIFVISLYLFLPFPSHFSFSFSSNSHLHACKCSLKILSVKHSLENFMYLLSKSKLLDED